MKHWQNPDYYLYTSGLNRNQWAWEFLRRNPDYLKDYQWFINQWQALEKAYGKAPNMDYQAWKQDPRSYKIIDLDSEQDANCAIAQDKLLIECWMGNKWGFFKFPRCPELNALETEINWRPLPPEYFSLDCEDPHRRPENSNGSEPGKLSYKACIDLRKPLKEQLEQFKQQAIVRQRRLKKQGSLRAFTVSGKSSLWTLCLRYLDALQMNENPDFIAKTLLSVPANLHSIDVIHTEAQFYVLHYLEILTLMEK